MTDQYEHIAEIIVKKLRDEATETEKIELEQWLNSAPANQDLFNQLSDDDWVANELDIYRVDVEEAEQEFWGKVTLYESNRLKRRRIMYGAAAAALVLIIIGYWFYGGRERSKPDMPVVKQIQKNPKVKPGGDTATLELADGRKIELRAVDSGKIASYENLVFVKKGGQVATIPFKRKTKKSSAYHNLKIPKGGQFQLVLPDGSKVWLNSESSIRFPNEFSGPARNVIVTGEAYFEVKKGIKPFVVLANGAQMEVLGTKFNVNAYAEEGKTIATVIEGKIKVMFDSQQKILQPNECALITKGEPITLLENADTNKITAWQKGTFDFHGDSLTSVVRQLGRWYNLNIVYEAKPAIKVSYIGTKYQEIDSVIIGLMEGNKEIALQREGMNLILKLAKKD